MLFAQFFPRLQARALARYGQEISERQFKDWREDGLLPGPAAPIGRGRGRSPDRHWPCASYRRALRICRYKERGAYRTSQWWLGLWLSGEVVAPTILKTALRREFSIARRGRRSFAESRRWTTGPFPTWADAQRGGAADQVGIGKMLGLTPNLFRRLSAQQFETPQGQEDIALSNDVARALLRTDVDLTISAAEARTFHRSGHMGEGLQVPGDFLDEVTEVDLGLARDIVSKRRAQAFGFFLVTFVSPNRRLEDYAFALLMLQISLKTLEIEYRTEPLFVALFGVASDKDAGINPQRRLSAIEESIAATMAAASAIPRDDLIAMKAEMLELARNWRPPSEAIA